MLCPVCNSEEKNISNWIIEKREDTYKDPKGRECATILIGYRCNNCHEIWCRVYNGPIIDVIGGE